MKPVSATVSIGVAALDSEVGDVRALFESTDSALYFAKKQGRNRVVAAGKTTPSPSPE